MNHVIVGGGVAGITAALELARRKAGEIHIYTEEHFPYYYRPQLSHFLAGELSMEELLRRPLEWYTQKGINIHLNSKVTGVTPAKKQIQLSDGASIAYDKLLLAAGSLPIVPRMQGADKTGVFTWRTLDDALAIKEYASHCKQVVVIGGGLLGLEAAYGLRKAGLDVTVLEFFSRLLPRQLDQQGAEILQHCIANLGLQIAVSAETSEIQGADKVEGVQLKDGRHFPAQMVLVATGVRCNANLGAEAGLTVDRGIVVDEYLATSAPDVYAAGDIATFQGRTWAIAPIAQTQGRIAAANMAGEPTRYEGQAPSTTLKIVGIDLTSVGNAQPEGENFVEKREINLEAGTYKKIVVQEDKVVGAIVIGDKNLAKKLEGMIENKTALGPDLMECML